MKKEELLDLVKNNKTLSKVNSALISLGEKPISNEKLEICKKTLKEKAEKDAEKKRIAKEKEKAKLLKEKEKAKLLKTKKIPVNTGKLVVGAVVGISNKKGLIKNKSKKVTKKLSKKE